MGQLSRTLRNVAGGGLAFFCPGCREAHVVWTGEGPGPRWGWNGNAEKPTFTPSVLVRSGHHASAWKPGLNCWCIYDAEHPDEPSGYSCAVCHTFVTDGRIQFLDDCTHALRGQTVDLPDFPARAHDC